MKCLPLAFALAALFTASCWAQEDPTARTDDVPDEARYATMRLDLLKEIEVDVRTTRQHTGRDRLHERVMKAMDAVPRHEFVPGEWRESSYLNRPLPIGEGQTISQPFIVALMTDLLDPEPDDVVLDIGTGSGYQAAVLAEVVAEVYSMEIIPSLADEASERLERLGYDNVEVTVGNGWQGWPEHAPFDGILVAAAASELPAKLVEQLKPGGKMVVPLKSGGMGEELTVVEKLEDGTTRQRAVLPVRFVPMTGDP